MGLAICWGVFVQRQVRSSLVEGSMYVSQLFLRHNRQEPSGDIKIVHVPHIEGMSRTMRHGVNQHVHSPAFGALWVILIYYVLICRDYLL